MFALPFPNGTMVSKYLLCAAIWALPQCHVQVQQHPFIRSLGAVLWQRKTKRQNQTGKQSWEPHGKGNPRRVTKSGHLKIGTAARTWPRNLGLRDREASRSEKPPGEDPRQMPKRETADWSCVPSRGDWTLCFSACFLPPLPSLGLNQCLPSPLHFVQVSNYFIEKQKLKLQMGETQRKHPVNICGSFHSSLCPLG